MSDFQVFSERIEREAGTDPRRDKIDENEERGEIPYRFQVADFVTHQPFHVRGVPAAQCLLVLFEEGFGEPAEAKERFEVRARVSRMRENQLFPGLSVETISRQFADRKRVEAVVVVAAEERIASSPVDVQPRAAGDEDFEPFPLRIEDAFYVVFPDLNST